jgi:predicted NodU family carbamoyl transferase
MCALFVSRSTPHPTRAAVGARFEVLSDTELIDAAAVALVEGKAVGWFQGRMEFGPRWARARFSAMLAPPCRRF